MQTSLTTTIYRINDVFHVSMLDVFHVSMLRKYVPDPSYDLNFHDLEIQDDLSGEGMPN